MARTPIHPGKILKDELDEIGISAKKLADAIGVPSNRVSEIIRGRRGITAETAVLLGAFFGTSAEFWLNLQMSYELRVARQATGGKLRKIPNWKDVAA